MESGSQCFEVEEPSREEMGESTSCGVGFNSHPFVYFNRRESSFSFFFGFTRRSHHGSSLPDWLSKPGPVFLRKFVRRGKNDDVVQKVELLDANPMYARVKFPDGKESNVSLRDIARCPHDGRFVNDGDRLGDDGERLGGEDDRFGDDGERLGGEGDRR